jgi:hypothetical protein
MWRDWSGMERTPEPINLAVRINSAEAYDKTQNNDILLIVLQKIKSASLKYSSH